MLRVRLLAIAALLAGTAAHAAEITTTTPVHVEPAEVTVRAHRLDKKADDLELRLRVPAANAVALHDGVWELRLGSDAFWAPRMFVRDTDSITLPVWPAVPLRGVIQEGVERLTITFKPLGAEGATGEAECAIQQTSWTCAIPPGHYDVRLATRESAPEFRWNVQAPGKLVEPVHFVAGASLTGRIEAVRGAKIALDGVELALTGGQQRYAATSDARGFFQFKGLSPGEYSLRARREGFAAQARTVTIVDDTAAELSAPLLLDRPKRLTVTLAPALDPQLKPWRVSLWAYGAGHRGLTGVGESAASATGEWSASGLLGGEYAVEISRAAGGIWKSVDVVIEEPDARLPLTLFGERVRGTVTLGEHPLAAELAFGGEDGATVLSGDDGRFEGEIPPDASDERTVHVDAASVGVKRTVRAKIERGEAGARMDIRLPATTLGGRVVGVDGSPAAGALVIVSADKLGVHQVFSEKDGSFQLAGIDAGGYRVSAEAFDGQKSERVLVTVADGSPVDVELVLKSGVVVRGRVGNGESPVIRADLYGIPRDTQFAPFMPQTKTNDTGRFELSLPPRTTVFDLVMVHPAFDTVLTRIAGQLDSVRHVLATQYGGTLTVETTSPQDLLLRHGGGECWLWWLANIPATNAIADRARLVVPRLEPGDYSVCSAKTGACGHGHLAPFGTLTLAVESLKSH